jgi:hypothetical protein
MQYNYSSVNNNNNNMVLNNNYGRLRDLILLFKISMDMRKNSFEVYRQLGHAPSKRLASPAIGIEDLECRTSWLFSCVSKGGYSFGLVTWL